MGPIHPFSIIQSDSCGQQLKKTTDTELVWALACVATLLDHPGAYRGKERHSLSLTDIVELAQATVAFETHECEPIAHGVTSWQGVHLAVRETARILDVLLAPPPLEVPRIQRYMDDMLGNSGKKVWSTDLERQLLKYVAKRCGGDKERLRAMLFTALNHLDSTLEDCHDALRRVFKTLYPQDAKKGRASVSSKKRKSDEGATVTEEEVNRYKEDNSRRKRGALEAVKRGCAHGAAITDLMAAIMSTRGEDEGTRPGVACRVDAIGITKGAEGIQRALDMKEQMKLEDHYEICSVLIRQVPRLRSDRGLSLSHNVYWNIIAVADRADPPGRLVYHGTDQTIGCCKLRQIKGADEEEVANALLSAIWPTCT